MLASIRANSQVIRLKKSISDARLSDARLREAK